MSNYGQYCPVARALEILGDRWTLLIIRDMLSGTSHFNDLKRGLPGISRSILATRMQQLQQAGIIEKQLTEAGRNTTEYRLTQAGLELSNVIGSLFVWGEAWAFDEPRRQELDPVLLMWRLRNEVIIDQLPAFRVVVQFDFYGAANVSFWLILTKEDVTLCLIDLGYEINVLLTADLATLFKLWGRRINYREALEDYDVTVEGIPIMVRAFPTWFGWQSSDNKVYAVKSK